MLHRSYERTWSHNGHNVYRAPQKQALWKRSIALMFHQTWWARRYSPAMYRSEIKVQHLGLAKERGKAVVCHSKAGAEICEVAGSEDQPRFRKRAIKYFDHWSRVNSFRCVCRGWVGGEVPTFEHSKAANLYFSVFKSPKFQERLQIHCVRNRFLRFSLILWSLR